MGDDSGIVMSVLTEVAPALGAGEVVITGKLLSIAEESVQDVSDILKNALIWN